MCISWYYNIFIKNARYVYKKKAKIMFVYFNIYVFSSSQTSDRLWGPPSLLFYWYQIYFPRVKRPGREIDHSPPSSAEFKNEWIKDSLLLCFHMAVGKKKGALNSLLVTRQILR
jgi:hypothetical protein